jgi:rhamnosyltransferase
MNTPNFKVSLLIPTYNAGPKWEKVLAGVDEQTMPFEQKIIIDSGSSDNTVAIAKEHGFAVITIPKSEFSHGGTRQRLADEAKTSDICTYLTQDAIPADKNSIRNLVASFKDDGIGMAYGRQLPHDDAKPAEIHARLFNYPDVSAVKSFDDQDKYGFKVFFCSNSFAAYRKSILAKGGFPTKSIMGEDALFAAKMLVKGYKLAYVADATVKHSHNYTFSDDFKRYFDTRVFHEQNKWISELYGKPSGEGIKYVKSELKYIMKTDIKYLFSSFNSLFAKWLGYRSGKYYKSIPRPLLKKLSMHRDYWQ